ncbi:hypothetical protein CFIMG_008556RA [Ceratocystis fimbriata CBS 114723]|uniref:NB-ARC domain-containing protein n=1 Tax=Ceratocystis fimbriata CBS 114723 TaxID=1035309 RepID=A0A2C5X1D5_9PEZI|nr:hypothetical protein CFIMG_008556RA [Ceratocystis fimbriata CBS 114723]
MFLPSFTTFYAHPLRASSRLSWEHSALARDLWPTQGQFCPVTTTASVHLGDSSKRLHLSPVPVYYIPFHENVKFVGRRAILSKLDRLFTQTGFQQVGLVGLGGIGKSQVALKFVYTVKEKYTDYSIFWLTAATSDHPSRLESQHRLAAAYIANCQIEKAVTMLEHVAEVREKARAADKPPHLVSRHELAQAHLGEQIDEAVSMLERVKVREKARAADNPGRLGFQRMLADAYSADS